MKNKGNYGRLDFQVGQIIRSTLTSTLLFLAIYSNAQSFVVFNQQTEQLLNDKDWPALIEEGQTAIESGLDFLGLRYRMGVAYYEEGNFFKSTEHFERALQYDQANPYVQEYLYYSYLFSGREKDTRLLASSFHHDLLMKTDNKQFKWLDFIYLETGAKQSNKVDSIGTLPFFSLGIGHRLGYRLDLYQAVNFLQQKYLQTDFRQLEYYLRADWQIGPGITLHPAFHYINLDGDLIYDVQPGVNYPLDQQVWSGYLGLEIIRNRWRIQLYYAQIGSDTEVDYSSLDLPYRYPAAINTGQLGLDLTFTPPFWGDRLWLNGQIAMHEADGTYSMIWKTGLSFYVNKNLSLHGNYFSSGGALQFVEAQAAILNNSIGTIDSRWSGNLEYRFGKHQSLLLGYQQEAKTTINNSFHYNTLFLGIKFFL